MHRLISWRRSDKNTMVSFQGHVVPPDTYRGGKQVSLKPPKPTPMSRVKISLEGVQSKDHMWKGKVDGQSNHLKTLVWVLFVCAMSGECRQKTDPKSSSFEIDSQT
jgi:hypothetical protein